jgi:hypothetical protein
LLWKDAWLKPAAAVTTGSGSEEQDAWSGSLRTKKNATLYFCQSTELFNATSYLPSLSLKRCFSEYRNRNVGFAEAVRFLLVPLIVQIKVRLFGLSAVLPVGTEGSAPSEVLGLQPGELVEVKQPAEIARTLDQRGYHRGMRFLPQMISHCGKRFRVKIRVDRIIEEETSRMLQLKDTVILEDAFCDAHKILGGCSRLLYILWREGWLRRVERGRLT